MADAEQTIRQSMETRLAALKQEAANIEKALAEMPVTALDKLVSEFHKLIGWL